MDPIAQRETADRRAARMTPSLIRLRIRAMEPMPSGERRRRVSRPPGRPSGAALRRINSNDGLCPAEKRASRRRDWNASPAWAWIPAVKSSDGAHAQRKGSMSSWRGTLHPQNFAKQPYASAVSVARPGTLPGARGRRPELPQIIHDAIYEQTANMSSRACQRCGRASTPSRAARLRPSRRA